MYSANSMYTQPGAGFQVPGWVKDVGGAAWDFAKQNAASIGSGLASYYGTQQTNAANAQMAKDQMAFQEKMALRQEGFQERMSSSAVQRHVADLKAAGLNPALAFSSAGASTPSGSMASGAMASVQDALSGGVSSAQAARRAHHENRILRNQADKAQSEALMSNKEMLIQGEVYHDLIKRTREEANSAAMANKVSENLAELYRENAANARQDRVLRSLELPRLQAEAKAWSNPLFSAVTPWLGSAAQVAGIASRIRMPGVSLPRFGSGRQFKGAIGRTAEYTENPFTNESVR